MPHISVKLIIYKVWMIIANLVIFSRISTMSLSTAMSTAASTVAPSIVLATNGPLLNATQWIQPTSCGETTTHHDSDYFLGYNSALGKDPNCFPPVITQSPSFVDPNVITIQYYSPALCPSGWWYAMSYSGPGLPPTTNTPSVQVDSFFGTSTTIEPEVTAWVCCPESYSVSVTSYNGSNVGAYPLCTDYAANLYDAWDMLPGWPTSKPNSFDIYHKTVVAPAGQDPGPGCGSFTVTASGFVVAWHATDTSIARMANYSILDIRNQQWPTWP
jgi:hypothetical protein